MKSYTYLHNISFETVPIGSDIVMQTFMTPLKAFLEPLFNVPVSGLAAFAAISAVLANRCPFRAILVAEK
jgi:hypothetical protein